LIRHFHKNDRLHILSSFRADASCQRLLAGSVGLLVFLKKTGNNCLESFRINNEDSLGITHKILAHVTPAAGSLFANGSMHDRSLDRRTTKSK